MLATILEVWTEVYDVALINISLIVSNPNHCAQLVSTELCDAFNSAAKLDPVTLESKAQTLKFDLYQNSVANAVAHIVHKMHWSALAPPQGSEDRLKCIKKLLGLLSWQMVMFCDGIKKVGVILL